MDPLVIVGLIIVGLILILYLYFAISAKIKAPREKLKRELQDLQNKSNTITAIFESKERDLNNRISELMDGIKLKDEYYDSLKEKSNKSISKITSLYADFLLIQYDISSEFLVSKKHPAYVEAKRIKELKEESKAHIEQYRQMLYKYETLIQLFPELVNYVDDFESIKQLEDIENITELQSDFDRVQFYMSKDEYLQLSIDERNQLALDRYIKGQKSKWQIGRDYELFCGMEYEKGGWDVEYIGMEKKLQDLGRDLIAVKDLDHHIVQCKYWSQEKLIHEKHITQLFGTSMEYEMNFDKNINVTPVLITNITISDIARKFADKLGVMIKDMKPLEEFPRIKCNINRDEFGYETRIYHLPFDQQYDRTKINKESEFYAHRVDEAVQEGFRRAYKYYGQ